MIQASLEPLAKVNERAFSVSKYAYSPEVGLRCGAHCPGRGSLMFSVDIELCGKPEGKGRPRFVRSTGMAFTPANTRAYEANLRYSAQEAMAGRPPLDGPVRVRVEALFPIPKSWSKKKQAAALAGHIWPTCKPDLDNCLKQLDSLNQVVWIDDSQVVEGTIRKVYSDRPALRITVSAVAGEGHK